VLYLYVFLFIEKNFQQSIESQEFAFALNNIFKFSFPIVFARWFMKSTCIFLNTFDIFFISFFFKTIYCCYLFYLCEIN